MLFHLSGQTEVLILNYLDIDAQALIFMPRFCNVNVTSNKYIANFWKLLKIIFYFFCFDSIFLEI
jgi:hypothetical protein